MHADRRRRSLSSAKDDPRDQSPVPAPVFSLTLVAVPFVPGSPVSVAAKRSRHPPAASRSSSSSQTAFHPESTAAQNPTSPSGFPLTNQLLSFDPTVGVFVPLFQP